MNSHFMWYVSSALALLLIVQTWRITRIVRAAPPPPVDAQPSELDVKLTEAARAVLSKTQEVSALTRTTVELRETINLLRLDQNNQAKNAVATETAKLHSQFAEELATKLEVTRRQTRAVNFGNHAQHSVLPLMAAHEAGIDPKDIHWLGNTVDFLCFQGLDGDDCGQVSIVLADAKTVKDVTHFTNNEDKLLTQKQFNPAKSLLNKRQQRVMAAVTAGRISFQVWLTDTSGTFACINYPCGQNPHYIKNLEVL